MNISLKARVEQLESARVSFNERIDALSISGSNQGLLTATEDIPAFAAVTCFGKSANSANTADMGKVLGLTIQPILTGFAGEVAESGEVVNPLWNWTAGDLIFINGTTLSKIPPTTGWVQLIGTAKNPTTILVALAVPVLL